MSLKRSLEEHREEEERSSILSSSRSQSRSSIEEGNGVVSVHTDEKHRNYILSIQRDEEQLKKRAKMEFYYLQKSKYWKTSLPRIIKSDIRRKFPMMFTNILNSCNINLIRSFLTTFCDHRDILFQHTVRVPSFPTSQRPAHCVEISRLSHVIHYMSGIHEFSPDMIHLLKNSQITRRIDCDGSLIILTMEANGSRIYPIFPSVLADCIQGNQYFQNLYVNEYQQFDDERENVLIGLEKFLLNYDINDPKSLHNCGIPLLKIPLQRRIHATIVLQLDEQNRIHRISLEGQIAGPDLTCPSP